MEIKSIIYENNNQTLIINIGYKNEIKYKDILGTLSNEKIYEYLKNLFCVINNWNPVYINNYVIDGGGWKLSILYDNGKKKEYSGKADYPSNFEVFEMLNQKLIEEVQYE